MQAQRSDQRGLALRRVDRFILAAAVVAVLVTVVPYLSPRIPVRYTSPQLRIALETCQALIALLVTHLSYGRFRRSGRLSDLLIAYGLGLFGAANLLILSGPLFGAPPSVQTWPPLAVRLTGAIAIVWGAWHPESRYTTHRAAIKLVGAHVATLGIVVPLAIALTNRLPVAVREILTEVGSRPALEAHPLVLVAQIALMVLYWSAAWGFADFRGPEPDGLVIALATGFVIAGFSRLNFFLYPSIYTDIIHGGDILRLGWYSTLLAGAAREIDSYWRGLADAAVADERRRTARELHDGLVQELSFIRSRAATLAGGRSDPLALNQVMTAADRALEESRLAISTLAGEGLGNLEPVLRRAAEDIAGRAHVKVTVENPDALELPPHTSVVLSRVVREASSNAVNHGAAGSIAIRVERHGSRGVSMTVTDDGKGFHAEQPPSPAGFGLRSMAERIAALGGELVVDSTPGSGTTIRAILPRV